MLAEGSAERRADGGAGRRSSSRPQATTEVAVGRTEPAEEAGRVERKAQRQQATRERAAGGGRSRRRPKREETGTQAFTRGLDSGAGRLRDRRQAASGGRRAVGSGRAAELGVRDGTCESNARTRALMDSGISVTHPLARPDLPGSRMLYDADAPDGAAAWPAVPGN